MDTLASYDELPYDSLPLPETQPDFLAAVAKLHGFDAPDPRRARILELGCAQGGNLIPLAWRWPESDCVGVELSRVQAEAGAAFIKRLGLPNVRIVHGDLAALPEDLGAFDYIIAHGVFSWVPPTVQQALLDVCRRHLSPQGVAYVSFNVAAGWATLLPLREALLARTAGVAHAPQRYAAARAVLDQLSREWDDPVLLDEIAYLKTAAPSYLFHEYLADCNTPMSFGEFAAQLDAHGLRYVGEAGPRRAVVELEDAWGLIPESMAGRWLDAECALDDALGTRFRRALIARADASCAQPPKADALDELAFYADLASDEQLDLEHDSAQGFVNPAGNKFLVENALAKAALIALSSAYPRALCYSDLIAALHAVRDGFGVAGEGDAARFRQAWFSLVLMHCVMPTLPAQAAPELADELGSHPHAHALARLQAATPGWVVSGTRHVAIDLDAPARELLQRMDGSRDQAALVMEMGTYLTGAGIALPPEQRAQRVDFLLWQLVRQGVCMAG
ncbi:methyltransferase domain-containing protein [Thiobacillus sp.]|uniref:methyltransferase domain-containing protein n=1 Tax=Thiobacillus sp. TaxID=924 RepID=UPI00286EADEF|nr:methyltransferase domain-containing protein [Thiobacillus sp.]